MYNFFFLGDLHLYEFFSFLISFPLWLYMGYILKLHSGLVWQTIILHKGYMCEIEQNSIIMWAETYKVQISHWSHKGSNNEVLKFPINTFSMSKLISSSSKLEHFTLEPGTL